jgi:hypothetical protein
MVAAGPDEPDVRGVVHLRPVKRVLMTVKQEERS